MKTAILIGLMIGAIGCGGDDAVPVDAGPAADACVSAQGNCGCIFEEDYNFQTGKTTVVVVCPDGGTK